MRANQTMSVTIDMMPAMAPTAMPTRTPLSWELDSPETELASVVDAGAWELVEVIEAVDKTLDVAMSDVLVDDAIDVELDEDIEVVDSALEVFVEEDVIEVVVEGAEADVVEKIAEEVASLVVIALEKELCEAKTEVSAMIDRELEA